MATMGQRYIANLTPEGPGWDKKLIYGNSVGFETAGLQERLLRRAVFLYWERRPDPREVRTCDVCRATCDHRVQVCECGPECPYPPVDRKPIDVELPEGVKAS